MTHKTDREYKITERGYAANHERVVIWLNPQRTADQDRNHLLILSGDDVDILIDRLRRAREVMGNMAERRSHFLAKAARTAGDGQQEVLS